jgi:hypothetical protein
MSVKKAHYGIQPTPKITNRRTGYVKEFGPRRAIDGAYVLEVLAASGCWTDDIEGAQRVLSALVEHDCGDWTVGQLLGLLPLFREQITPEQMKQLKDGDEAYIRNGEFTIVRSGPKLTVVE